MMKGRLITRLTPHAKRSRPACSKSARRSLRTMAWSSRAPDGTVRIPASSSSPCSASAFPLPTAPHSISKKTGSSSWQSNSDWPLRTSDASSAPEANGSGSPASIQSGHATRSPLSEFPTAEGSNLPPKTSPCSSKPRRTSRDVLGLLAKIAYMERPAWHISSCISPVRTVRSYVRPVFWPFSHGHDEIRGANRLISFSRCNALAILRSDLLRDVVPLAHHNWHLACLSDW